MKMVMEKNNMYFTQQWFPHTSTKELQFLQFTILAWAQITDEIFIFEIASWFTCISCNLMYEYF